MENIATWKGNDPLTLKVTGTGEFVKNYLCNIVQHFEDAEYDRQEEMRQEVEDDREFYD